MGESTANDGALWADITQRRVPAGCIGLWWLGQSGFVIRGGGMTVYIDPFLSVHPRRQVPPPFPPEQVTNADLVLCTHDHHDHVDPLTLPGLLAASPQATVCVPGVARDKVAGWATPTGRVLVPVVHQPRAFGPLTITAIPAAHETLDYSPDTGYPYLGYLMRLDGITVYHSGDCTMYDGLTGRLKQARPDIMLLPINGGDWKRRHDDIVGNMSYREAADLAAEVGPDLVIPMHYDMFAHNSEPPGHFVDYVHRQYPELKVLVMGRHSGITYCKPEGDWR